MKTSVKYSDKILAPRRIEDRPSAQHLPLRGRVELVLYRDTVPIPDLTTQGLGILRQDKISLLAADDGIDLRVEQVTGGKSEFYTSQPASVDHVYGFIEVCHGGAS
jgi:hypothetical protein